MTIVFKAKTREGGVIKILVELLKNNFKNACFVVDKSGINLRVMDQKKTVLVDIQMAGDNFSPYRYKGDEIMYLPINLENFYNLLRSVKKKDSVQLFVDDDDVNELGVKIIPEKNTRKTTSFITIQKEQNIDIDLPSGYGKPILVPSGEFQRMCKGLKHISSTTSITTKGLLVTFSNDAGGVLKRATELGETEESDEDVDEDSEEEKYYEDFETDKLNRISKIAGLSQTILIYAKNDLPLLFRTAIGSLGTISVYVKPKSLVERDSRVMEEDA
jgi:proliferating cell nuclear antigen PCNA